jgi:putative ABC transport system permease protein
MIKKYLTPALRHVWRHPLFTALNIIGLAIGISACWVIYRIASYESGFETNIPDAAHIYNVIMTWGDGNNASAMNAEPKPLYQSIEKEASGLLRVVPVFEKNVFDVKVITPEGSPRLFNNRTSIAATSPGYFALIPYHWLAGNPSLALTAPDQVVLTQSAAESYFPGKSPQEVLNRTLTYNYEDTVTRTVVGVVADFRGQSELSREELVSLPVKAYTTNDWHNSKRGDKVFVELAPNADPLKVQATISAIHDQQFMIVNQLKELPESWKSHDRLLPLSASHFATEVGDNGVHKANKNVLLGLVGIALFLLVLACINYINMSVASIPQRAKEIGVRKTLGSSRTILIGQFLCETFICTLLAAVLAYPLGLTEFSFLKEIVPEAIAPTEQVGSLALFILFISLAITVISGLYPGWLITKVKTVNIFRHGAILKHRGSRVTLQRSLIVLQFAITIVFLTGAVIVGRQLHYVLYSNPGFNKDAIVLANVPWYLDGQSQGKNKYSFAQELKSIPGVQQVSVGEQPMDYEPNSWGQMYSVETKNTIKRTFHHMEIDTAYLNMFGIHLLAGRNLEASDTAKEFILNETAVKQLGFRSPQDAIGKMIGQDEGMLLPIVGVVKDFHFMKFNSQVEPLLLTTEKDNIETINIKLAGHPRVWQNTLKAAEQKWDMFYPSGTFNYTFYDEAIASLYSDERHLDTLVNLTMVISISISCMGLFGLAVLTAYQRTKEIGIRKVMGASVSSIMSMLSKEYLRLILISFVIATPINWYLTHKWLDNFAFKLPLHWWLFALSGLIALLTALVTVSFQAWKVAKANPVVSLRTE